VAGTQQKVFAIYTYIYISLNSCDFSVLPHPYLLRGKMFTMSHTQALKVQHSTKRITYVA